jgi:hypothetical protein
MPVDGSDGRRCVGLGLSFDILRASRGGGRGDVLGRLATCPGDFPGLVPVLVMGVDVLSEISGEMEGVVGVP